MHDGYWRITELADVIFRINLLDINEAIILAKKLDKHWNIKI